MSVMPLHTLKQGGRGSCGGSSTNYRGTSLIRNRAPLGPYSRTMPRAIGGGRFLMSEVPL